MYTYVGGVMRRGGNIFVDFFVCFTLQYKVHEQIKIVCFTKSNPKITIWTVQNQPFCPLRGKIGKHTVVRRRDRAGSIIFLVYGLPHRTRIYTEEKAKVVAAAGRTELIQYLAALAI